jgi:hypothetical protein
MVHVILTPIKYCQFIIAINMSLCNPSSANYHNSAFSTGNPSTVKELSLAKATAMTSPHATIPDEGTPAAMATATTVPEDNPNIDELTAVGNTEDALQIAKTEPGQEAESEEKVATAAVAQMFDLAAMGGLQLTGNGMAPAAESIFAQNMGAFPQTTAQDLEALAALAAPMFNQGLAINPLGPNAFGEMQLGMDVPLAQQPFLDPSPYIPEPQETQVSAYAKLEFEDGEFYMNTFSVILGRDQVAARRARKRELLQAQAEAQLVQDFNNDPRTPKQIKREGSRYSKSIVSESGGIMREGDDPDPERRLQRRIAKGRKSSKISRSDSISSHSSSRRNSYIPTNRRILYEPQPRPASARHSVPMTDSAVPVDPDSLRPDPSGCPLIGIHPNVTKGSGSYKNISREHVKISFNSEEHVFEAHMIGRNGAFHDRDSADPETMKHYPVGSKITLTSGCYLQIADVRVKFVLPDVRHGETGAERPDYAEEEVVRCYSEGGKEMSFDFEDDPRPGVPVDSNDEEQSDFDRMSDEDDRNQGEEFSDEDGVEEGLEDEEERDDEDDDEAQEGDQPTPIDDHDGEHKSMRNSTQVVDTVQLSPKVEKKRGPGRPPKDGIMSKREKQLAKKEALAQAQSGGKDKGSKTTAAKTTASKTTAPTAASPDAPAPPVKNKVGRPRKHPLPEVPAEPRQKRKYTKRKPKEPKDGEVKQEGSGGDNPVTPAKKEKPPKEPQSPPLVLVESDYTEEQLQKPAANYVQLIFEALSNHPEGQMTLPQIYKAIERRYPWFHFKAQTNGWQSSVRHNLGQNTAFQKVTREGKGWKWALQPGASIEKEKKRRATPPPQAPPGQMQPIYSNNPYHMMPGQPYGHPHMMGPPGYHYGMPPNMPPGQYPYMGPPLPHMNGQPHHPSPYSQLNGPPPVPAIMPPQLAAPNAPSSYSSPYAPKPQSSSEPQPSEKPPATEERQNSNNDPPHGLTPQPTLSQEQKSQALPPQQEPQTTLPASQLQPQSQPLQTSPSEEQKPPQLSRPVPNAATLAAVQKFKEIMRGTATTHSDMEAIVDSASNQVLGYKDHSVLPEADQKYESQIKEALISMLKKITGANVSELLSSNASVQQNNQGAATPPVAIPDTNQNGTQGSAPPPPQQPTISTGTEKSAPSIMRPQFNGHSHTHPPQNRPNIPIPRPPMISSTNNMKRTNSGSPAPWGNAQSGSPVRPVANGANATTLSTNENAGSAQIAGQKRAHDEAASDAEDMREFKRLSTSGLPQVKT